MVFAGRYQHNIDDKNRLAIPAEFRDVIDATVDGKAFYVLPETRYLQLIPEKLFNELSSAGKAGLAVSPEMGKARRLIFASACRVVPDKTGRIVVPDQYMKERKQEDPLAEGVLGREVTLVGADDRIEIWNRADFAGHYRELLAERSLVMAAVKDVFATVPGGSMENLKAP